MLTEYQEQVIVFQWANLHLNRYPELELLHASLNGVKLTIGQAMKAKRSGMIKGVPDISLPIKRGEYSGLYIELKRIKGGVVSKEQKRWLALLAEQGFRAVVCNGADSAIAEIKTYLES